MRKCGTWVVGKKKEGGGEYTMGIERERVRKKMGKKGFLEVVKK